MKPEFWSDEKLGHLSPLTRLVFLGLISQADDAGRLVDSIKLLDGLLFPYTDDSCEAALLELAKLGRIRRYRADSGQAIIQLAHWDKHQKVKNASEHVLPPAGVDSGENRVRTELEPEEEQTPLSPIPYPLSPIPIAAEEPPPEKRSRRTLSTLPEDWMPSEKHAALAKGLGVNLAREVDKFRDWATARAEKCANWDARFNNWLRTAAERLAPNGAGHRNGAGPPGGERYDDRWMKDHDPNYVPTFKG